MPIETILSGLAVLGGLFCCAIVLRRRLKLELRPALPQPTREEQAWLDELAALQLESRHKYC